MSGQTSTIYHGVYTIMDEVSEEYVHLFAAKTEGAAIRLFKSFLSSMDNLHYKDDYILCRVGDYCVRVSDEHNRTIDGNILKESKTFVVLKGKSLPLEALSSRFDNPTDDMSTGAGVQTPTPVDYTRFARSHDTPPVPSEM